jgi:adenylosuccinate synthase
MANNNITVIGLQWGDEGKGKIVDALARNCRYVARYCGGANAGHSVVVEGVKFALHLIPCGVLHKGVMNVVGNGVAFDPLVALEEIQKLRARGVNVGPENMAISLAANIVMPYHKLQDRLTEERLGAGKIGTTARGIGPCYSDKASRTTAIRVDDLIDADRLAAKIAAIVPIKNAIFAALFGQQTAPLDGKALTDQYVELGRQIAPMACNTGAILRGATSRGERVLFEGGQGSMLDIDHGTFPFVTSSSVSACGVPTGAGVPPSAIGQVVGLIKAYSTRVGSGPFPSEQANAVGDRIRERGHEYGTTTGRPRRCGWFDAFAARYAADLSGVDELALSLLDVLCGLDQVLICTGYTRGGKAIADFDAADMTGVQCVYETLPGWREEISDCRTFEQLPAAAKNYVNRIEQLMGRPVGIISVGPDRLQTIRHHSLLEGLA